MKTVFKSKTLAAAFVTTLAGAVSYFVPEAKEIVAANAGLILVILGLLNFVLRLVTKEKVVLFPEQ